MRYGPGVKRDEVVLVDQLSKRLAPVVPDSLCLWCAAGDDLRQMRKQIVAAPFFEFVRQLWGPISAISFKRVGEDRVRRSSPERFYERFADGFEVSIDSIALEGVENPALGANGGPLDHLS